jgi:hypothetical protein
MKVFVILREIGEYDSSWIGVEKVVSSEETAKTMVEAVAQRAKAYKEGREAIPGMNRWPLTHEVSVLLAAFNAQFPDFADGIKVYSQYVPVVSLYYEEVELE